jgi:hypothetical protein
MPLTKIQSLGITDGTIVNADINASAAIAGTKLTGVNDAKAWVNFNGTGTVAIRASFNVSSITDNGTGDYSVNFTTAMSDANFCVQLTNKDAASQANFSSISTAAGSLTTALARFRVWRYTGVVEDVDTICVAVFR